jgi:hypothetical protein
MTRRLRGSRGSSTIEMPLAVGVLLLPIVVIVLALPQWPERQTTASSAAKQAATIYASAPDETTGFRLATEAVGEVAANNGVADGLRLELSGAWCRGCTVVARVTVAIPSIQIPFGPATGRIDWTASSAARIADFKSLGDA